MSRPYFEISPSMQLQEDLSGWSFNERVMQMLLESEYIRKLFGRVRELDYSNCVARLLMSKDTGSVALKSSLCRQILATPPTPESLAIIAPALVHLLRTSESYYVKTCVCASLVMVSADTEQVKNCLM